MSIEIALAHASDKAAGKRPYFLAPEVERVMAITMAVVQELAVTRTRLDSLERVLQRKNLLTSEELESFAPTKEESEQRALWMQEYITRVLRIVQQEAEQIAAGAEPVSGEIVAESGRPQAPQEAR